ncbi:hypothetical protein G6F40_017609 [Rhizopus arrhizus]|nr:hypothetical protein G6F40_017609 [Rhizopus arrhizus]
MLFEPAAVGIIDVDHCHAIGRQRRVDRALGDRHAKQAAHPFQMGRCDVVDQRVARAGDIGQSASSGASITASGRPISLLRLPGLA